MSMINHRKVIFFKPVQLETSRAVILPISETVLCDNLNLFEQETHRTWYSF